MNLNRPSRLSSLVLIGAALSLSACGPLVIKTQLNSSTQIEGADPILGALLEQFPGFESFSNIDFNANQELKNQGVTKDQIDSMKITAVTLTLSAPDTEDFSFLDEIAFSARAGDLVIPVASKKDISKLDLSAPNPTLTLDVTGQELLDVVTAPSMTIEVTGKGRAPSKNVRIDAVIKVRVEASPF